MQGPALGAKEARVNETEFLFSRSFPSCRKEGQKQILTKLVVISAKHGG